MSKQKKDKAPEEIPIDFQIETKNYSYTLALKEQEIESLKKDNQEKTTEIANNLATISDLRNACFTSFKSEKELLIYKSKFEDMEREYDKLKQDMHAMQKKYEEEKTELNNQHLAEVNRLKQIIDGYHQKVEMVNQLQLDKEMLTKQVEDLTKEKNDIIAANEEAMRQKEVRNQIKFSKLKQKMMDNINQTQSKVTELNIQYMDVSTKLTLLQNHQLLIQLEYQSQQIEELSAKNQSLEKKIFELTKDIEIHKEVELSLAEKNKRLRVENSTIKSKINTNTCGNGSTNEIQSNENAEIENSKDNKDIKDSKDINSPINSINVSGTPSQHAIYTNVVSLQNKILNLEKKLNAKNKEFNKLKDNTEYVELRLRNYEKKYSGLFNFFEESLRQFSDDEEIKNNKDIFLNIESLQQGDFSSFTKEEKYSILVILMKYLLPLINSSEGSHLGVMGNINLKFHYSGSGNNQSAKNQRRYVDDSDLRRLIYQKGNMKISTLNQGKKGYLVQNSVDSLPSIKNPQMGNSFN